MAILHVAQIGHPVLRCVADPVDPEIITSRAFQDFLDDMLETMIEYDGAGLAAPQVHHSLRVVCLTLSDDLGPEFFINPEVTPLTHELRRSYEGCLSIEDMRAAVERPRRIRVLALGRDGREKGYELEGFAATVVQHECDHLDGVLFVDRCDTTTLAFLKEYRRFGPLDEWEPDDLSEELELVDEFEDDTLEGPVTEEVTDEVRRELPPVPDSEPDGLSSEIEVIRYVDEEDAEVIETRKEG